MGKTNLLLNAKRRLEGPNDHFIYFDLSNRLSDPRELFRHIVDVAIETKKPASCVVAQIEELRSKKLSPYHEYDLSLLSVLSTFSGRFVIILDEVDALSAYPSSDKIFSQIRSTYFMRENYAAFKRLTYVLAGVAEPRDLIKDPSISPFNIGQKIYLDDFTRDNLNEFAAKAMLPLQAPVLDRILYWGGGNPRMSWDICAELELHLLAGDTASEFDVDTIVDRIYLTRFDRPPVDHIRTLVRSDEKIREAIRNLRNGAAANQLDESVINRLYLAGIIPLDPRRSGIRLKSRIIDLALSERRIDNTLSERKIDPAQSADKIDSTPSEQGLSARPIGRSIAILLRTAEFSIIASILVLVTWWTAQPPRAFGAIGLAFGGFTAGTSVVSLLIYRRYLNILGEGGSKFGSLEKQAYDALRESLAKGGSAARLYAHQLSRFLDAIDLFFGDFRMADQTLFPHAFGLKTPSPLWTAPAFGRWLVLTFAYPIVSIFVIWVLSGHVGRAEAALGLAPDLAPRVRLIAMGALGIVTFVVWRVEQARGSKSLIWFAVAAFIFVVATFGRGAFPVVLASSVAIVAATRTKPKWSAGFLAFSFIVMILACLVAGFLVPRLGLWNLFGPWLLFLGLLPLLSAPFGWTCLGLARALLRRGLELGGWWPYVLAIADAVYAALIVAQQALTLVVGAQAFDDLVALGGGHRVLPLGPFFDGIATHPTAPEYWWVYALLFSTMIPSIINLVIGGTSLMRGIPGVSSLLVKFMPTNKAVPAFDRAWIATVLTLQLVGGAILGILVQFALIYVVFGYVMPWLGLELLDVARAVADFDLPGRIFGRL
jgi:hypothetical protein